MLHCQTVAPASLPSAMPRRFWQCQPLGYLDFDPPDADIAPEHTQAVSGTVNVAVIHTLAIPASAINLVAYSDAAAEDVCSLAAWDLEMRPLCKATAAVISPASGSSRKLLADSRTTVHLEVYMLINGASASDALVLTPERLKELAMNALATLQEVETLDTILQAAVTDPSVDVAAVAKEAAVEVLTQSTSLMPAPSTSSPGKSEPSEGSDTSSAPSAAVELNSSTPSAQDAEQDQEDEASAYVEKDASTGELPACQKYQKLASLCGPQACTPSALPAVCGVL